MAAEGPLVSTGYLTDVSTAGGLHCRMRSVPTPSMIVIIGGLIIQRRIQHTARIGRLGSDTVVSG
ncbi:MAG TPA: hypothetical protein ENJ94_00760 [Gammaproteobacteria bacterium]|nr:hypothetical protein [Gammaproteobacteria bacterium]